MTRLLYGNLDAELGWGPPEVRELPAPVRAMISAAATTMAAFAAPGDVLWLPSAVDEERLPALPGIDRPTMITGAPPRHASAVLAWGATEAVSDIRRTITANAHAATAPAAPAAPAWLDTLWSLDTDARVASAVNHRGFSAGLCTTLGIQLPGSRVVRDLGELDAHLSAGGFDAGHDGWWVIKAPHSASGRLRLRQRGATIEATARVRAARLFERYGPLVFEPWLDRVADFGCVGLVTEDGHHAFGPHLLDCDAAGVWRGLRIDDDSARAAMTDDQFALLLRTVEAVGSALWSHSYRGPFGIDAYLYRGGTGAICLHPLSEINARVSFGHVARALLSRMADGRGTMRLASKEVPTGSGIIPLLLPHRADATSAWLEV